jgi:hypothetical protein
MTAQTPTAETEPATQPRDDSTPPTPKQAVADQIHDERTEGYARRPFRTNPHDK